MINLSRTKPELHNVNFTSISCDLSDVRTSISLFESALNSLNFDSIEDCVLINNAGVLSPMYPVGSKIEDSLLEKHLAINTLIPMEFSSRFIYALKDKSIKKMIINVGSGAANQAIEGWAVYGASKAALHYFNNTVAKEQTNAKNPVLVSLFDPGRTDTGMQLQIRTTDHTDFPLVESFKTAFDEGKLNNPDVLAKKLVEKISSKSIQQGDVLSHRDL